MSFFILVLSYLIVLWSFLSNWLLEFVSCYVIHLQYIGACPNLNITKTTKKKHNEKYSDFNCKAWHILVAEFHRILIWKIIVRHMKQKSSKDTGQENPNQRTINRIKKEKVTIKRTKKEKKRSISRHTSNVISCHVCDNHWKDPFQFLFLHHLDIELIHESIHFDLCRHTFFSFDDNVFRVTYAILWTDSDSFAMRSKTSNSKFFKCTKRYFIKTRKFWLLTSVVVL